MNRRWARIVHRPDGVSQSQAAQHWFAPGQPKRAYSTAAEALAFAATLDTSRAGYNPGASNPYRCGLCGMVHLGTPPTPDVRERFMVEWTGELGVRATAHLLAENGTHSAQRRRSAVRRRVRSAMRNRRHHTQPVH